MMDMVITMKMMKECLYYCKYQVSHQIIFINICMNIQTFIDKANKKHQNKYDYSKIVSLNITHKDKIIIICPKHGEFIQSVNSHLLRSGCPICGKHKNVKNRSKGRNYFINKAVHVHQNKYDYSLVPTEIKATDKVNIICPDHGKFTQRLNEHMRGHGCPKCARESTSRKNSKGIQHFISRCQIIHGDRYDYSKLTQTVKIKDVVTIKCNKHGEFNQVLDAHLAGSGCPKCAAYQHVSKPELEIQQLLHDLNIEYVTNNRTLISPKEIDILIPSHKIAIEYCGLYWHSETRGKNKLYHKNKLEMCTKKGYRLFTIFEDEWIYRKKQVIKKLKTSLQCNNDTRIYARKCNIVLLDTKSKKEFFNNNHIQGDGISSINIGLEYNNEVVAAVGLACHNDGIYYLNRYATSTSVIGGFSKILKYFQRNYVWKKIISFADLRWSIGNLYKKTGWTLDCVIPPDYSYVRGNNRYHKFNYRRKYLPKLLKHFDRDLSEKENCDINGILRIWDCGKQRWILESC